LLNKAQLVSRKNVFRRSNNWHFTPHSPTNGFPVHKQMTPDQSTKCRHDTPAASCWTKHSSFPVRMFSVEATIDTSHLIAQQMVPRTQTNDTRQINKGQNNKWFLYIPAMLLLCHMYINTDVRCGMPAYQMCFLEMYNCCLWFVHLRDNRLQCLQLQACPNELLWIVRMSYVLCPFAICKVCGLCRCYV
jgi:hypothetical protein